MYESDEARENRFDWYIKRTLMAHRRRMRWWKRARRAIAVLRRAERFAKQNKFDLTSTHRWYGQHWWSDPSNTGARPRGQGWPR